MAQSELPEKDSKWIGMKGFDEAKYYNDEKYEININRPDQLIKDKILEAYSRRYQLAASNIKVDVEDGIVTLSGNVPGYQEKKEASDLICNFSGVKAVNNDLNF